MSVADINARVAAAVAAIDAGDYATAHAKLLGAKALLAATPDTQKGSASLRWDRSAIDALLTDVERQIGLAASESAAGSPRGVRRSNVRYRRADAHCED